MLLLLTSAKHFYIITAVKHAQKFYVMTSAILYK